MNEDIANEDETEREKREREREREARPEKNQPLAGESKRMRRCNVRMK